MVAMPKLLKGYPHPRDQGQSVNVPGFKAGDACASAPCAVAKSARAGNQVMVHFASIPIIGPLACAFIAPSSSINNEFTASYSGETPAAFITGSHRSASPLSIAPKPSGVVG